MNIEKYLPLTETTFYILMALLEPGHGYVVMQRIEQMSDGDVRTAAGTMYGALDNLSKQKLIMAVSSDDPRRKNYQTTDKGRNVLSLEGKRLKKMLALFLEQEEKL